MNLTAEEIIKKYKGFTSFKFKNPSELETLLVAIKNETCDINEAKNTIIYGLDIYTKYLAHEEGNYIIQKQLATFDEILSICRETLLNCIRTFDINKIDNIKNIGKSFAAYYGRACKNKLITLYDNLIKHTHKSLDNAINNHSSKNNKENGSLYSIVEDNKSLDIHDQLLLKEIKENIIPKLPLSYQRILISYFFEGKKVTEIAKIEGLSHPTISKKLKRALSQLKLIMENASILAFENTVSEDLRQTKVMNKMQNVLAEFEGKIDYDTELIPYLSDEYKEVFLKYIKTNSITNGVDLSLSMGRNKYYVVKAAELIINKIRRIIERKQEIAFFYERVGGELGLEDLKLFLNEKEKVILEKYILSINPDAFFEAKNDKVFIDSDDKMNTSDIRDLNSKIDRILERKQLSKEFIEMNGGEDFLLYDFGSSLIDDHFEVLITTMMDYHYTNKEDVSISLGKGILYVSHAEDQIIRKLDNYYTRKKEIDDLVEAAGGADKVITEIYNKLDENEKIIFVEYTLAYILPPQKEIADKVGKSTFYVYSVSNALLQKLQDMAAANQKA